MDTLRNLTIAAVVSTLLSVIGIILWEVAPYNRATAPYPADWLGFPAWSLFGLALFITFVTVAVDLVNQCMTHYHQRSWQDFLCGRTEGKTRYVWLSVAAQGIMARIYVVLAITVGATWSWDVVRCGVFFCTGDPSAYAPSAEKVSHKGDIVHTVMGLFLFFTFLPMGAVLIVRIFLLSMKLRKIQKKMKATAAEDVTVVNAEDEEGHVGDAAHATTSVSRVPPVSPVVANAAAEVPTDVTTTTTTTTVAATAATHVIPEEKIESMRFYVSPPTSRQAITFALSLVALLVCMLMGYYFLNDLHRLTAKRLAEFAAETVSIEGIKNTTSSVPEVPNAFFRTRVWSWSSTLRFKTFPGNCFFYTYLFLVVIIVWGLRQSQQGRHWMQRRASFFPKLNYAEVGLAAGAALLTLLFFIYWAHDHNYKSTWTAADAEATTTTYFSTREVFARAMGQLAALFLSLLLLPVSRHSVLHTLLGTSWESFLFAHRFLGYAFLAAMVVHALSFYSVFALYGQFWHNIFFLPPMIGYRQVKVDFTVVLMEWWIGPLLVIAMGVGAYWKVRRQFFEIFYYSHLLASYSTLGITLLHAPASWQYMLPGLTLWLVDRLVRLFQRSALVDVGEARVISEDICEVGFRVRGGMGSVMQTGYPGQYVFLNVAELSALQWHPFTLSSVAGGGATRASAPYTVHIKSMGPGTWTQRLYDRIARGEPLTLAVEGPCGSPLDVTQYEEIYLVCGGIGVTPCASIFGSVLRWAREGAETGSGVVLPRRVKLIWACRSSQLVQAMAPALGLPQWLHPEPASEASANARSQDEVEGTNHTTQQMSTTTSFEVSLFVTTDAEHSALMRLAEAKADAAQQRASAALATARGEATASPRREGEEEAEESIPDDLDRATSPLLASLPISSQFTLRPAAAETKAAASAARLDAHTTSSSPAEAPSCVKLAPIEQSRPRLVEELAPTGDPAKVMVMVCGPAPLVDDTVAACVALGLAVRTEEFEL